MKLQWDVSKVELGDTVVARETEFATIYFTRWIENRGIIDHYSAETERLVLRIDVDIDGKEPAEFEYIDYDYWTITIDGRPRTQNEPIDGTILVDDEKRTIDVMTSESPYVS